MTITGYTFEDTEVPAKKTGGRVREATPFDDVIASMALGSAKKFECAEKDFDDVRKLLRSAARHAKRGVKIYPTGGVKGKVSVTFTIYEPTPREKNNAADPESGETAETNNAADQSESGETAETK